MMSCNERRRSAAGRGTGISTTSWCVYFNSRAGNQTRMTLCFVCSQGRMPKFVLVTSIGTGDSQGAPPPQVYEALKPVLLEKVKAEDKLKELAEANGMEFCIVRPGGLKSEPATGTGVLTEDVNICGAIHRADVASLVVKCVLKASTNGKVLSCVDKEQLFDQPAFEEFAI